VGIPGVDLLERTLEAGESKDAWHPLNLIGIKSSSLIPEAYFNPGNLGGMTSGKSS
jgi:hypothetical protein